MLLIYTFMCMIIFLRIIILSFQSYQACILSAGLGMESGRTALHFVQDPHPPQVHAVDEGRSCPGSRRRCGFVLLIGEEVLGSDDVLMEMNLRLRSLWASTSILLKPWNGGFPGPRSGSSPPPPSHRSRSG